VQRQGSRLNESGTLAPRSRLPSADALPFLPRGRDTGTGIRRAQTMPGYVRSDGNYTTLNVPGSIFTSAEGINDAGQIVRGLNQRKAGIIRVPASWP
jgi:hypothetical protein